MKRILVNTISAVIGLSLIFGGATHPQTVRTITVQLQDVILPTPTPVATPLPLSTPTPAPTDIPVVVPITLPVAATPDAGIDIQGQPLTTTIDVNGNSRQDCVINTPTAAPCSNGVVHIIPTCPVGRTPITTATGPACQGPPSAIGCPGEIVYPNGFMTLPPCPNPKPLPTPLPSPSPKATP